MVRSYGGEVVAGRVVEVTRTDVDRFRVALVGGHIVWARRVLAATGLVDELPDIDGLADHWGGDVIHCPFCHGFEVRDRRIAQIVTHPMALHTAGLFRQLSDRFTLVLQDGVEADDPEVEGLKAAGVNVIDGRVRRIITGDDGHVAAIELTNGDRIDADAVAVGPRFKGRAEPFAALGLKPAEHHSGLGDFIETDAVARPLANEADWDHRYGCDQMWSGKPNGTLVNEIAGRTAGRALDVGAGEGGDAVWLAEQGWNVTASDISTRALDHIAAEARRRDDRAVDASSFAGEQAQMSIRWASATMTPSGPRT